MRRREFDFAARMKRARLAMREAGIEVLLASVGSDLPYLTGYTAAPSERLTMAVIPAHGPASLVVPHLEAPRVTPRPDVFEIVAWEETGDPVQLVAERARGAHRIAISDQTWSVFLLDLQSALPESSFGSARSISSQLRIRKDAAEIACLREAAAAVDRVAERLGELRFSGKTEFELSEEVAAMVVAEGSDIATFRIVGAGPNAASPHHEPGDRVIGAGDAVVVDFGGKVGGYCSDTTRTFHVGEPEAEYRTVHRIVGEAQKAAIAAVAPGMPAASVDAAGRAVIEAAGYGEYFFHRIGHGIGLDVHEDPYLVAGNTEVLEPGMAFSVEPGIYLPGRFGVRIEDIVVCGDDGAEPLNTSSHDLLVVE